MNAAMMMAANHTCTGRPARRGQDDLPEPEVEPEPDRELDVEGRSVMNPMLLGGKLVLQWENRVKTDLFSSSGFTPPPTPVPGCRCGR